MALHRLLPPNRDRTRPDISLFIVNIVLLLILFFLATGQITNGQPVEERLALTENLPLDILPQPLLEIGRTGDLTLAGDRVAPSEVVPRLAGGTDLFVLIAAETEAAQLVDLLVRSDFAALNIELVTIATRSGDTR